MGDEIPRPPAERIEVVLRDLDVLLRKKFGDWLVVDDFTTSSLVALGENYGSTILKVDAVIRRDGRSSEPEMLYLVAKMIPPTEYQRMMFDSPFTFPKEIYMFTDVVPAYKALEREYGIPESEVFDPLPELFGARLSLEEGKDKFDNDAVILMENLKEKNYACADRMVGVDLEHARLVVEALARFHGLGIALKFKKPALFEEFKIHAEPVRFKDDVLTGMIDSLITNIKLIPILYPYLRRIEKALRAASLELWLKTPAEPWATIVHSDFWINNVMFRDDASGNPKDIKFIDFQIYLYQNPARDLLTFIFSSCRNNVLTSNVEELVDLYYEKLTSYLARLDCDLKSFSRKSFDEQVADAAYIEFLHCVSMTKVTLADAKNDPDVGDIELLFTGDSNNACREKMTKIILKFIDEKWI